MKRRLRKLLLGVFSALSACFIALAAISYLRTFRVDYHRGKPAPATPQGNINSQNHTIAAAHGSFVWLWTNEKLVDTQPPEHPRPFMSNSIPAKVSKISWDVSQPITPRPNPHNWVIFDYDYLYWADTGWRGSGPSDSLPTIQLWESTFRLNVSLWAMAFAFVCLAGALWYQRHRSQTEQYRLKHNMCTNCGYDLRATPDRCPECGAIPSKIEIKGTRPAL